MSIVFAAISPHSPILIPSIGKENTKRLEDTLKSFAKLENDLLEINPDTILIISPHGQVQENAFTMNLSPKFEGNFEEFGDYSIKVNFNGDIGLAYKIREKLETKAPLQLMSETNLDYGSLVPLYLLTKNLPNIKIIPIYYSGLSSQEHFDFGKLLQEELFSNNERIAVIASGDLSHSLTKDSPAPYSSKGKKFDAKIIEYLNDNDINSILKMKESLITDSNQCGLRSILILQGILSKIKHDPKMLSYEHPFGVGYMVMNFIL
ncbi:MAG: AmmeMemoRadiSam system protein B [Patescibacteria group bacterium]|jgi:aromatic ring-opening dioxygenase LigB subunit|nr:AmmeMemoRadiSam system protein B [Patescibacteria group bacterium]